MYTEQFTRLARKSQAGDRRALITLLRLAHTPVSFQCRKLLRDDRAAEALTRQILAAVPNQLSSLRDPGEFEKWICRITASRCMLALSRTPEELAAEVPSEPPNIPGEDLDETQTARLVQQLVDSLPQEPRICLLLYSCANLKLKGISQLTGFPAPQVLDYLNQAQKTINAQLRKYHRMGVHFAAIPALSSLVRTAMYDSRNPKAAAAVVSGILPRKAPASPVRSRPRLDARLLIAIAAAGVLLLMLLAVILFLETRPA